MRGTRRALILSLALLASCVGIGLFALRALGQEERLGEVERAEARRLRAERAAREVEAAVDQAVEALRSARGLARGAAIDLQERLPRVPWIWHAVALGRDGEPNWPALPWEDPTSTPRATAWPVGSAVLAYAPKTRKGSKSAGGREKTYPFSRIEEDGSGVPPPHEVRVHLPAVVAYADLVDGPGAQVVGARDALVVSREDLLRLGRLPLARQGTFDRAAAIVAHPALVDRADAHVVRAGDPIVRVGHH
jgi:hypothetical protein